MYHNPVRNIKGFIFFQPSNFLLGKMADDGKTASASRSTQKEGEFGLHLSVDYKTIHPSSLPSFRFLIGLVLTDLFVSSHICSFFKLCVVFQCLGAS